MLARAYELRYQVYCLERGFLSPHHYPDGKESDDHDEVSTHFGAFDRREELAGYVRLVQPADDAFPFEAHCQRWQHGRVNPQPHQAAEISRLMVRRDYRQGRHDGLREVNSLQMCPQLFGRRNSASSAILLHLYKQMYGYSIRNGIRYWYAAMEAALARSLMQWDFAFEKVSDETDYFGPVALYLADLRDLEARVGQRHPELLAWLQTPELAVNRLSDWKLQHVPRGMGRNVGPSRRSTGHPFHGHALAA